MPKSLRLNYEGSEKRKSLPSILTAYDTDLFKELD